MRVYPDVKIMVSKMAFIKHAQSSMLLLFFSVISQVSFIVIGASLAKHRSMQPFNSYKIDRDVGIRLYESKSTFFDALFYDSFEPAPADSTAYHYIKRPMLKVDATLNPFIITLSAQTIKRDQLERIFSADYNTIGFIIDCGFPFRCATGQIVVVNGVPEQHSLIKVDSNNRDFYIPFQLNFLYLFCNLSILYICGFIVRNIFFALMKYIKQTHLHTVCICGYPIIPEASRCPECGAEYKLAKKESRHVEFRNLQ